MGEGRSMAQRLSAEPASVYVVHMAHEAPRGVPHNRERPDHDSMSVIASPPPTRAEELRWLPDFCSIPVVFAVMVVAELLVLVIVIAPTDETVPLLPRLATASAFVQWLALVCVVCLCQLQPRLQRLGPAWTVGASYLLVLVVTLL